MASRKRFHSWHDYSGFGSLSTLDSTPYGSVSLSNVDDMRRLVQLNCSQLRSFELCFTNLYPGDTVILLDVLRRAAPTLVSLELVCVTSPSMQSILDQIHLPGLESLTLWHSASDTIICGALFRRHPRLCLVFLTCCQGTSLDLLLLMLRRDGMKLVGSYQDSCDCSLVAAVCLLLLQNAAPRLIPVRRHTLQEAQAFVTPRLEAIARHALPVADLAELVVAFLVHDVRCADGASVNISEVN
jgi:hypothetical protein